MKCTSAMNLAVKQFAVVGLLAIVYMIAVISSPEQDEVKATECKRVGRNGHPSMPPIKPDSKPLYRVLLDQFSEEQ
ncbi:hypothetical protein J8L98_22200 [Pseudoalteromonas sp. MMG013]|uniref:hypothetical protein n=1 Tax=Pseudoalteromonas sp. MMG013 TaxID=2822687 RepID=UPI001B38A7E6|nr:hypothetical protein [Pseudoalteromonas sp. MMG013]MBQ4864408.1 hypothetical protein [Pseudoalteromonas sp. MMG013]